MRIAVNTRFLLKDKMEGFGWFTYETMKRITMAHPEHEFIFLFDRPFDERFIFSDNITPVVIGPPARHPILFRIWFNRSVTKALKKYNADLFFSPDGFLSLKTDVPQIGVIHDLNFEHYPLDLPKNAANYLRKYMPKFARRAKKVITVSEFSKQDIVATYNIDPDKITVAYNGGSGAFQPLLKEEILEVRKKYADGKPYFLFVGALHPRKNLDRLLKAFNNFKKETNSETKLVIVGAQLWKNKKMQTNFNELEFKKDIHFTGHLSMDELTKVTGAARAMAFVSYFEGFGIPLVEAMKAGCPVLCGNRTSLPEVVGDAALLVDPFSIEDITQGLKKMDESLEFRNELKSKGLERSKRFTWDNSAGKIWEVIHSCLNEISDKDH